MIAALVLAAATSSVADTRLETATALYDRLCLRTFPDDAALDRAIDAEGAKPMSAADVKVTLRDDPGRAWTIDRDGISFAIFLELPPYHACSVRFRMPDAQYTLDRYEAVAARYRDSIPGFTKMKEFDADQAEFHIHAVGDQRTLADGGGESLFVIDQHITDVARRSAGETGVMLRFVHQIAEKGAK